MRPGSMRLRIWHQEHGDFGHSSRGRPGPSSSVGDLVDFIRNQTPPPDNFMSMPDDSPGQARRRKRGGFRMPSLSSLRRNNLGIANTASPVQIRLPDSAIAGTTIGGHRHIAISIPVQYLPLGPRPRCQYPVYPRSQPELPPESPAEAELTPNPPRQPESVLRFTDDSGLVTVLRAASGTQSPHLPLPSPVAASHASQSFSYSTPWRSFSAPLKSSAVSPADHVDSEAPVPSPAPQSVRILPRNELPGSASECDTRPKRDESPILPPSEREPPKQEGSVEKMACSLPTSTDALGTTSLAAAGGTVDKAIESANPCSRVVPIITVTGQEDTSPGPETSGQAAANPSTLEARGFGEDRRCRRDRVRDKKKRDMEASRCSSQSPSSSDSREDAAAPAPAPAMHIPPSEPGGRVDEGDQKTGHGNDVAARKVGNFRKDNETTTRPTSRHEGKALTGILATDLRMHDMERRMRRLEKNGDTWLRAIVPVLSNLNKTLVMIHSHGSSPASHRHGQGGRGSRLRSRDAQTRFSRVSRVSRQPASSPLASPTSLFDPGDTKVELAADSDSSFSGLEMIEPIMRELQGASRLSLESSGRIDGDDEEEDNGSIFGSFESF